VHTEYVTTKAGIRQVESLYKSTHPIDMSVMWDGYLNDCTGWASEAISFVLHLERVRVERLPFSHWFFLIIYY